MSNFEIFMLFMLGFCLGQIIGMWGTAVKWRGNADRIQRIESGGKLYKVVHDD